MRISMKVPKRGIEVSKAHWSLARSFIFFISLRLHSLRCALGGLL